MLGNIMGTKHKQQQRRTNRRLNKTGIRLVMDVSKMNNKWRKVYNVNALSTGEKINLYDIMHNKVLRNRYMDKLITRTR